MILAFIRTNAPSLIAGGVMGVMIYAVFWGLSRLGLFEWFVPVYFVLFVCSAVYAKWRSQRRKIEKHCKK
jgi:hypothetical protein